MWNWDLLVVIRKCDRPVPSKSRSPLLTPALSLFWSVQPSSAPCFIPHFCPLTLALSFFTLLTDYWLHCWANLLLQLLVFSGFMTLLHNFITAINTPGPKVQCFNTQSRKGTNTIRLPHISSIHTPLCIYSSVGCTETWSYNSLSKLMYNKCNIIITSFIKL